jgi:transposase-like protein
MDLVKSQGCRKNGKKKCNFEFKIFVIEQIKNGQISLNYAAKKYNISRSTLDYWQKKLSNYGSKNNEMNKEQEVKKLRERNEKLECIKDFHQDIIAKYERVTGSELSKKYLPKHLWKEIQKKKQRLSK